MPEMLAHRLRNANEPCNRLAATFRRLSETIFYRFIGFATMEPAQIQRFGARECDRILFMFNRNATIRQ
jgi:hypothetical protein